MPSSRIPRRARGATTMADPGYDFFARRLAARPRPTTPAEPTDGVPLHVGPPRDARRLPQRPGRPGAHPGPRALERRGRPGRWHPAYSVRGQPVSGRRSRSRAPPRRHLCSPRARPPAPPALGLGLDPEARLSEDQRLARALGDVTIRRGRPARRARALVGPAAAVPRPRGSRLPARRGRHFGTPVDLAAAPTGPYAAARRRRGPRGRRRACVTDLWTPTARPLDQRRRRPAATATHASARRGPAPRAYRAPRPRLGGRGTLGDAPGRHRQPASSNTIERRDVLVLAGRGVPGLAASLRSQLDALSPDGSLLGDRRRRPCSWAVVLALGDGALYVAAGHRGERRPPLGRLGPAILSSLNGLYVSYYAALRERPVRSVRC